MKRSTKINFYRAGQRIADKILQAEAAYKARKPATISYAELLERHRAAKKKGLSK